MSARGLISARDDIPTLTAVLESSSLDRLVTPSKRVVMLPLARCIACDAVLGRGDCMRCAGEEGREVGAGGGGMSTEDLAAVFPCICVACLDNPGATRVTTGGLASRRAASAVLRWPLASAR